MFKMLKKDDIGLTGVQIAATLIAFLIVAAVFSYVMLRAGFFSAQKSQELVHSEL